MLLLLLLGGRYSAESFVSNALRFPSSAHDIAGALNSTVRWMVEQQNDDGTWGVLLSGDGLAGPNTSGGRARGGVVWCGVGWGSRNTGQHRCE